MSKTILAIEACGDVRHMLQRALTEAGYQVVCASDCDQGLELLLAGTEPVDLIITDIDRPRLEGVDFIAAVRKDGRHGQTPILILADDHDALRKDQARRAGASGWMVKPLSPVRLVDAVRRVAA